MTSVWDGEAETTDQMTQCNFQQGQNISSAVGPDQVWSPPTFLSNGNQFFSWDQSTRAWSWPLLSTLLFCNLTEHLFAPFLDWAKWSICWHSFAHHIYLHGNRKKQFKVICVYDRWEMHKILHLECTLQYTMHSVKSTWLAGTMQ